MARNHPFLSDVGKKKLKQSVESVENRSSAEVVVAVRPDSGNYRYVDYLAGAILAYLGLAFMLLIPSITFSLPVILLLTFLLFVLGALMSAALPPVRRAVVGRKRLDGNVLNAARAEFYRLGVSRTRDRSGILVYVSLLEKRCRLVPDIGVMGALGREKWETTAREVEAVIVKVGVGQNGTEALAHAVEGMGPVLENALPRRADDINELPDIAEE